MHEAWAIFIKSCLAVAWFLLYPLLYLTGVFLFFYGIIKIFNL